MLSSFKKWFEILALAYSSWAAALGTILAAIALCNFMFRVLNVSVSEAFAWLLVAYQKTFHPPVDYVLSVFSLRAPPVVKDALVFYAAGAGILYRMLVYQAHSPVPTRAKTLIRRPWRTTLRVWFGNVRAAVLWPLCLKSFLKHPSFIVAGPSAYGRIPPPRADLPPDKRKAVVNEMLSFAGEDTVLICDERQLLAVYALTLAVAVIGLIILNAAVEILTDAPAG